MRGEHAHPLALEALTADSPPLARGAPSLTWYVSATLASGCHIFARSPVRVPSTVSPRRIGQAYLITRHGAPIAPNGYQLDASVVVNLVWVRPERLNAESLLRVVLHNQGGVGLGDLDQ